MDVLLSENLGRKKLRDGGGAGDIHVPLDVGVDGENMNTLREKPNHCEGHGAYLLLPLLCVGCPLYPPAARCLIPLPYVSLLLREMPEPIKKGWKRKVNSS